MTEKAPADAAPAKIAMETVTLETPIIRGETSIAAVQLRKPKAGALRGLQLQSVLQGDVNAMITLIPRITEPPLLQQEAENLEAEDLAALAATVMGFFMSKADQAALAQMMGQGATPEASTS